MSNWEQYQTAYQAASEEVQTLVNATAIPECVAKQLESAEDIDHKIVINIFVDYYLKISTEEASISALKETGIAKPQDFFSATVKCIDGVETFKDSAELKFAIKDEPVEQPSESESHTVSTQPVTPVSPMRTMATDIEKIHGYGALAAVAASAPSEMVAKEEDEPVYTSNQETVLQRTKVADAPAYTADIPNAVTPPVMTPANVASAHTPTPTPPEAPKPPVTELSPEVVPAPTPPATPAQPPAPAEAPPAAPSFTPNRPPVGVPSAPNQTAPTAPTESSMPSFSPQMHATTPPAHHPQSTPPTHDTRWGSTAEGDEEERLDKPANQE